MLLETRVKMAAVFPADSADCSGVVTRQQMQKTGAILDVLAILIIFAIAMTLGPMVLH